MSKLKYQPSIYVAKEPDETAQEFTTRILMDPRLLPDQKLSLELDSNASFGDFIQGIWLEQAPLAVGQLR